MRVGWQHISAPITQWLGGYLGIEEPSSIKVHGSITPCRFSFVPSRTPSCKEFVDGGAGREGSDFDF